MLPEEINKQFSAVVFEVMNVTSTCKVLITGLKRILVLMDQGKH